MRDYNVLTGLECCQTYPECSKCPYNTGSADDDECKSQCMGDAISLINQQNTEIERLQHILISFMNEVGVLERKYGADTSNIPAIAVLGTEKENIIRQTEAETIKRFANELSDRICEAIEKSMDNPGGDNYFITDVYDTIKNLVKEKAGGE